MLKTAFIGQKNFFNEKMCNWLSEHTDLKIIIWTNNLSWAQTSASDREKRILRRFSLRVKKKGIIRAADEFLYYVLYSAFLSRKEQKRIKSLVQTVRVCPQKELSDIPQIMTDDINSQELVEKLKAEKVEVSFAMCIDTYLPKRLINQPQYGSFLWHEGITPEYRGVYSPFWALARRDNKNLGYTLLRMNSKLDAGDIYVQGRAKDVDPMKHWHSYIGHKAIIDSLPETKTFLIKLERNQHQPIRREDVTDAYYSYPTATSLVKIFFYRIIHNLRNQCASRIFELGAKFSENNRKQECNKTS